VPAGFLFDVVGIPDTTIELIRADVHAWAAAEAGDVAP
jgi:hypothetical protein